MAYPLHDNTGKINKSKLACNILFCLVYKNSQ